MRLTIFAFLAIVFTFVNLSAAVENGLCQATNCDVTGKKELFTSLQINWPKFNMRFEMEQYDDYIGCKEEYGCTN